MINYTVEGDGGTFIRFDRLFKKTNTGAIQYWEISVSHHPHHSSIAIEYGQLGTDSPQRTVDLIQEGKNKGRSNATTPAQQAEAEAGSKWKKQVDKGYVQSVERAQVGEKDVEGYWPMLAKNFDEQGHKIVWPAMVQPKLDGMRCIAIVTGNGVTLQSRTCKPINSMKHIESELFEIWKATGTDFVFDGELYNHELKDEFEAIISHTRKKGYDPETSSKIQYHIYDIISAKSAIDRQLELDSLFSEVPPAAGSDWIKRVETVILRSELDMMLQYEAFMEQGYEGAMVRQYEGKYQNKRSDLLQKVKEFHDAEWVIVDVNEGRGKMRGKGVFTCVMATGVTFDCKMDGPLENLTVFFEKKEDYIGKQLTVQYQGFYKRTGKPRFPVGQRIREEE